ncbi:small polypeptide DEVIL 11 [Phaseolus vulgaris]|uniref:small polypeptide DEVIL 11 n=1 Tax=Phaseolus vulgaris TaxID=3885 RepID=UPI0035C950F6
MRPPSSATPFSNLTPYKYSPSPLIPSSVTQSLSKLIHFPQAKVSPFPPSSPLFPPKQNPFRFISMASSVSTTPTLYFDEKWKLSKKEGSTRSRSSSAPFIKNSSQRRCAFASKCARLVKEQRARFYIMRRCVTMLICWRDYSDS